MLRTPSMYNLIWFSGWLMFPDDSLFVLRDLKLTGSVCGGICAGNFCGGWRKRSRYHHGYWKKLFSHDSFLLCDCTCGGRLLGDRIRGAHTCEAVVSMKVGSLIWGLSLSPGSWNIGFNLSGAEYTFLEHTLHSGRQKIKKKKHGNKRNTRVWVCVKLTFWRCNCPFCLSCSTSAQWSQRWSAGGRTEWHTQWLLARSDLQTHIHKVNHHYMLKLNVLLIMLLWTFSSEIKRKCILPTSNRERFQLVLKFQRIS